MKETTSLRWAVMTILVAALSGASPKGGVKALPIEQARKDQLKLQTQNDDAIQAALELMVDRVDPAAVQATKDLTQIRDHQKSIIESSDRVHERLKQFFREKPPKDWEQKEIRARFDYEAVVRNMYALGIVVRKAIVEVGEENPRLRPALRLTPMFRSKRYCPHYIANRLALNRLYWEENQQYPGTFKSELSPEEFAREAERMYGKEGSAPLCGKDMAEVVQGP